VVLFLVCCFACLGEGGGGVEGGITCELRSNTACSATACVPCKENIYCVFLEDKMRKCSDEVQCFLDYKFPDNRVFACKRLDFLSLAKPPIRMLCFSTYKVLV